MDTLSIQSLWDYLVPSIIVLASFFLGLALRRLLFRTLTRWAEATRWRIDDLVIKATHGPFLIWMVMLGVYVAVVIAPLPEEASQIAGKLLLVLLILSVTLAMANFLGGLVQRTAARAAVPVPTTTLTRTIIKLTVLAVGILVILNTLGISITPILTALGIGGLAVALALQDTLSNLFAGFYVTLARQVRVGDYIRVEGGEEGYVVDINWRTTTLRTRTNNLVIIPNAKLAQSVIINHAMPEPRLAVRIPVGVSYSSDPAHVERVLREEALRAIAELDGFVKDQEPVVRFTDFGDFSLDFLLIVWVEDFDLQFALGSELRHRIFRRFQEEGIEIPFPIRTVYLRQDQEG